MSLRSLLLLACCSLAAADWTFSNGKATIARKGDSEGSSASFGPSSPLASTIPLASKDILKLSFTLADDSTPGRPHQAFLLVKDANSELETFYPLTVKESSGRAKIDLSHKDIPAVLLSTPELSLSLALGGFGPSAPTLLPIGTVAPVLEPATQAIVEKQKLKDVGADFVVFGPKNEITHTFRPDPKSPPKAITLAFLGIVLSGLVGLFVAWFAILGANFGHLAKAWRAAPVSHPLFLASLIAMEGLFYLYYTSWNLFEVLAGGTVVGVTAFLSGSRALREVRARRERGER